MSIYAESPLLTYAPVVDRKGGVVGAHFRIHGNGKPASVLASTANALSDVWPNDDWHTFTEFVGFDSSAWIEGWQPRGKTAYVADTALVSMAPGYRALRATAPKLCVRGADVPPAALPSVGYLAVTRQNYRDGAIAPEGQRRFPVVALDVNDNEFFMKLIASGVDYHAGWAFMDRPQSQPTNERLGMISSVLSLIEIVERDGSLNEIEAIFKRDAVLSYKLISMANSAAFGLSVEVSSLQHALQMIGMARLKRWLMVLLAKCGSEDTPRALLQAAFVRATMLETLGRSFELGEDRDDLFWLGAFSLLDRILGIPLAQIFENVVVSESIVDALSHREGPYAALLDLVEASEQTDDGLYAETCGKMALDGLFANHALLKSIRAAQALSEA
jgi:c-di-GMP phosphodiesterase